MPRLLEMGEIVKRALRIVDLEHTSPFTQPEVKTHVSMHYGQLYSHVVKSGYRYFEDTDEITATGAASYPLPTDHDCSIGIDRVIDAATDQVEQLDELMVQERDLASRLSGQDAIYYSIVGQSVVLFPRPTSGTYRHIYVPQSPDISTFTDAQQVDLVTGDGENFMVYGVAVKLCPKTELDPRLLIDERNAAEKRFIEDVAGRALVNPRRQIVRPTPFEDDY